MDEAMMMKVFRSVVNELPLAYGVSYPEVIENEAIVEMESRLKGQATREEIRAFVQAHAADLVAIHTTPVISEI